MSVAGLAAMLAIALGVPVASAGAGAPTPAGVFLACGLGQETTAPDGASCQGLPDAISAAETFMSTYATDATIELLPGEYCPIDLGAPSHDLTIAGVGDAGYPSSSEPVGSYGYEAEHASFAWNDADCAATPPGWFVQIGTDEVTATTVTLENLAVVGSDGGPTGGILASNINLDLRDVLVEDLPRTDAGGSDSTRPGLSYEGDWNGVDRLSVAGSAFVDDVVGADVTGHGAIVDSTFADNAGLHNSGIGLYLDHVYNGETGDVVFTLDNDTIVGNQMGIEGGENIDEGSFEVANTIIGDSSLGSSYDCWGGFQSDDDRWENATASGYNLIGSSCQGLDGTDIALSSQVGALGSYGGPTPSIPPPSQAQRAGEQSVCDGADGGVDQREFLRPEDSCDIGAVQWTGAAGTVTPSAAPSSYDFGAVAVGDAAAKTFTVSNAGGDVMGVSGVSVAGGPFAVTGDTCTYDLLLHVEGGYCDVTVQAAPTVTGEAGGTLEVDTTGGELDIPLSVEGGPEPGGGSGSGGDGGSGSGGDGGGGSGSGGGDGSGSGGSGSAGAYASGGAGSGGGSSSGGSGQSGAPVPGAGGNTRGVPKLGRPNTRLTARKLNRRKRTVTLRFKAIGAGTSASRAARFQCALAKAPEKHRKAAKPRYRSCNSPKSYRHLAHGTSYVFYVRARNTAGVDKTPAKLKFRL